MNDAAALREAEAILDRVEEGIRQLKPLYADEALRASLRGKELPALMTDPNPTEPLP